MEDYNSSNEGKTIWNFDQERMQVLSRELFFCGEAMKAWDVSEIYTYLRSIRRIIYGICKPKNKERLSTVFSELEKKKRIFDFSSPESLNTNLVDFFNCAEETFDTINEINFDEGFSFNRKEDEEGL